MFFFTFKTRSSERNARADKARLHKLVDVFETVRREIEHERSGLRARYERASDSAAFCVAAAENEGEDVISLGLDGFSRTMSDCAGRLARLKEQAKLLDEVNALFGGNASSWPAFPLAVAQPLEVLASTSRRGPRSIGDLSPAVVKHDKSEHRRSDTFGAHNE